MVSRSQPERGGTRNPGKKGWGSERQRWSELYEGQVSLWFALGYSFIEHNEQILSGWCLSDSLHLIFVHCVWCLLGFLGGSDGKESICNMEDLGSVPGLGRSPGEGTATHSNILAWKIPMDRGAWQATVHGVTKSWTQLSDFHLHIPACDTRGCLVKRDVDLALCILGQVAYYLWASAIRP